MKKLILGSVALAAMIAGPAIAADLPVKAPPKGVAVGEDGFYVWLDGSYQRVNLPNYSLGFKQLSPTFTSSTIIDSFNAHASGGGVAGGVGYLLPYVPSSTWLGSDLRMELAGSWVGASATQTGGSSFISVGGAAIPSLLNGVFGHGACFAAGSLCQTAASLHTDYSSWETSGRIASDYRYGLVTLTPSLGLFGGNIHNDQNFAQTLT